MEDKILLIEGCNFFDYPPGGQLTFSLNMMEVFGNQLVLVGWGKDDEPVGELVKRYYNGVEFDLFTIAKRKNRFKKPMIPDRLITFMGLYFYKSKVIKLGLNTIFTSSPEAMFLVSNWDNVNICYRLAGINNPFENSRYKLGRVFSSLFDKYFIPRLKQANCILAASDMDDIEGLIMRTNNVLKLEDVKQFPTRVDTRIFNNRSNTDSLRNKLGLSKSTKIIVTCGRLGKGKGWQLMIDAFNIFQKNKPDSCFYFIGDGEDRSKINDYIIQNKLSKKVFLLGSKKPSGVAAFLNAADLFIMGSEREGWSTTLVEALACNTPVCVTDFSSAKDLVFPNVNGYIVGERNAVKFAELMHKAIKLKVNNIHEIDKYSIDKLKSSILELWKV
jgi:glycosyltransferase involved in cell wall biosynthesis